MSDNVEFTRGFKWKRHPKSGSTAKLTFACNAAAEKVDEILHDGESHAGAGFSMGGYGREF